MNNQELIQYVSKLIHKYNTRDLAYTDESGALRSVGTSEKFAALLVNVIGNKNPEPSIKAA